MSDSVPVGGIGWPGLLYLVFPQGSLFLAGGSGKAVGSLLSFGSLTRSPHLSGRWGCGLSFITSLGLVSVSKMIGKGIDQYRKNSLLIARIRNVLSDPIKRKFS